MDCHASQGSLEPRGEVEARQHLRIRVDAGVPSGREKERRDPFHAGGIRRCYHGDEFLPPPRDVTPRTEYPRPWMGGRWTLGDLNRLNYNEINIVENGFLNEFKRAQSNLSLCTANRAACTGSATGALRFDNRGVPGQVDLPIMSAAFSGLATGSGFASGSFVTTPPRSIDPKPTYGALYTSH